MIQHLHFVSTWVATTGKIAQTHHPLQPHLTVKKELLQMRATFVLADDRVLLSSEAGSRCLRLPTSEICSSGASPSLSATRPRKRGLIVLAANLAEVEAAAAMTGVPPILLDKNKYRRVRQLVVAHAVLGLPAAACAGQPRCGESACCC